jgi:hypothetical protein
MEGADRRLLHVLRRLSALLPACQYCTYIYYGISWRITNLQPLVSVSAIMQYTTSLHVSFRKLYVRAIAIEERRAMKFFSPQFKYMDT